MRHGEDLASAAALPGRTRMLLEPLAFAALMLYAVEMIVGGPGFWGVGPVSARKLLFALAFAVLALCAVARRMQLQPGSLLLMLAIIFLLAVWMVLIPGTRDLRQLRMAAADASAFLIVPLAVLAYEFLRRHRSYWSPLLKAATACLALVALANVGLWLLGYRSEAGNEMAQAITLAWFTLGNAGAEPPLYVGPMPDGFFRAMWITAILYVPAVLFFVAQRRWWLVLLFGLALFASYTRSLWLVTAVGLVLAQWLAPSHRAFMNPKGVIVASVAGVLAVLAAASVLPLGDLLGLAFERLVGTFSDVSAQERFDQVDPLLMAWSQSPLFGAGFGASAVMLRSEDAPYSYELAGLALLMKLGLVGCAYLLACLLAVWARCLPASDRRTPAQCAALASVLALLGAGLTNPLLLNSVGISVLGFLFIFVLLAQESADG